MHGASIQHGSCSPLGGAGWSEQSCPMWRAVASLLPQLPAPVPGSPEVGGEPWNRAGAELLWTLPHLGVRLFWPLSKL